jgi:hypothetical protein
MSKRLPIGHGIFSGDVTRRPSPACRRLCFETVLDAAAPLLSDVAGNAALLSLALSQRHFNQQGVFEGRHVTIVSKGRRRGEGGRCDIGWGGIA